MLHLVILVRGGAIQMQGRHLDLLLLHSAVAAEVVVALVQPCERIGLAIEAGEVDLQRVGPVVASIMVVEVRVAAVIIPITIIAAV